MKAIVYTLFTAITFLLIIGCQKNTTIEPIPAGSFQYKAYDTTGTPLITGWFTLIIHDSSHISGEWHFRNINGPHNISGPQVGDGQLSGHFQDSILSIDLNPNFVDNIVFLYGRFTSNEYVGTWNWMSEIGWTGRGSFEAHRQ